MSTPCPGAAPASILPAPLGQLGQQCWSLEGTAAGAGVGTQGFSSAREGGNTPSPSQPLLGKGSSSLMKLIDNVHFFLEALANCQGW